MKKFYLIAFFAFLASFGLINAQNDVSKNLELSAIPLAPPIEYNFDASKSPQDIELKYINGPMAKRVGWASLTYPDYYVHACIDFTAAQMMSIRNGTLNSIRVGFTAANYLPNLSDAKIWIKKGLAAPVFYEQVFTVDPGNWTEITLATPYTIINTEPLVIGWTLHFQNLSANEVRPFACSDTTTDSYKPGGFNYRTSTVANGQGAGVNWNQYTSLGNLPIIGIGVAEIADKDLLANRILTNLKEFQIVEEEYTYIVEVQNKGLATQNSYTVQLLDENDNVLGEENITNPITTDAIKEIPFKITHSTTGLIALKGKVILEGDEIPENNITPLLTNMVYPIPPIAYCDRTITSNVYWPNNDTKKWYAIRIPKEAVAPSVGLFITHIEIGIPNAELVEYILPWIAMGDFPDNDSGFPEEETDLAYFWDINNPITVHTGWNVIPLETPIEIANENLFIGYEASALAGFGWGVSMNTPNVQHGNWVENAPWTNMLEKYPNAGNHAIIATVAGKVCPSVKNFKAEYIKEDTVCLGAKLTWTAAEEATTYTIKRDDGVLVSDTITGTSYIDENFDFLKPHTWTINYTCETQVSLDAKVSLASPCKVIQPGISDIVKTEFRIIPNPATDKIRILSESILNTIEVMNFLGQTIISQHVDNINPDIDISNLSRGVYFVRVTSENGTNVKKFVKK